MLSYSGANKLEIRNAGCHTFNVCSHSKWGKVLHKAFFYLPFHFGSKWLRATLIGTNFITNHLFFGSIVAHCHIAARRFRIKSRLWSCLWTSYASLMVAYVFPGALVCSNTKTCACLVVSVGCSSHEMHLKWPDLKMARDADHKALYWVVSRLLTTKLKHRQP